MFQINSKTQLVKIILNYIIVLSFYILIIASDEIDDNYNKTRSKKILSRRRRYLVFPEGSSIQVVYDQIIPIVDYTNLFILGVTVALAWELPSKPPSEIVDELKTKLNNGTLGLRKDENIDDLKYQDLNDVHSLYKEPYREPINLYRKPSYYTNQSPLSPTGWIWNKKHPISSGNYGGYETDGLRKHQIYPVFGKRSANTNLTRDDELHLRYHRTSRLSLYRKIEKYLNTQGNHGQHCILKALCETGKKRHETEPGSLIGEIIRTIFTFPNHDAMRPTKEHLIYDEAHNHQGDCGQEFHLCNFSIWNDFIF